MKNLFGELEKDFDETCRQSLPIFRILILFENEDASDRATRLYEHLFRPAKDHNRVEHYCWCSIYCEALDELVETITMADIIIVAGCETSELPKEIQTALKTGLTARRADHGALVALLGRTNIRKKTPSQLHLFLQKLAHEFGLNFFPGAFEIPEERHSYDFDSIRERTTRLTPTLDRILHRNVRPIDYGINE
jgi:hypothetical protein